MISRLTSAVIDHVAAGMSPSEATALVVMGKHISADAVRRIELVAGAYMRRLEAERAIRRGAA